MLKPMIPALLLPLLCMAQEASVDVVRTIRLRQSDAQVQYLSKIYELQNNSAESLLPFVKSAVLRYSRNSSVCRVTGNTGKEALLVSTGKEFIPQVDAIVAALDRKGMQNGKESISGTGVSRIAYTPKFRAANEISDIVDMTIGSAAGRAYVNAETNTIFWRDQQDAAQNTLKWVETLDRPIPQIALRLNYYELRDSDLKDWGFDYLAWKNGPGVNMLNLSYNAGKIALDQMIETATYAASCSWAYGGFFTAPQIDMSFVRCLQQSGNASAAAHASLMMLNTPVKSMEQFRQLQKAQKKDFTKAPFIYHVSMTPEYQNVSKNTLGRSLIGKSYYEDEDGNKHGDPPRFDAYFGNPFVCLPDKENKGALLFSYKLFFKNVVERGNTGSELSNSVSSAGSATIGFGQEKLLAIYEKENDVEQTIGLPILCRIPVLKYLFSTVTSIKERTYVAISAEAVPVNTEEGGEIEFSSMNKEIKRRIEDPLLLNKKGDKEK